MRTKSSMKNIARLIAFSLPLFLAIQGCKKDTGPDPSSHEYYQPVQIGKWYRYAIDSSFYKHNDTAGTVQYSIIESFDTDVPNTAGKLETRIKLERIDELPRRVVGFSYIQRFYNAAKQEYSIERVDNDVRYVLFTTQVFPGDTFNRNLKNILPADVWTKFSVGSSGGGAGGTYDHTLRIVKEEYSDSVSVISDFEMYAFNVGLFYKERKYIKGRTDTVNYQNIPIEQRIDTIMTFTKSLVDMGDIQ